MKITHIFLFGIISFHCMDTIDPKPLPRDVVSCKPKYRGTLYLSFKDDLENTNNDYHGQAIGNVNLNDTLVPVKYDQKFQFNQCNANGWNKDEQSFGQVQSITNENSKAVITSDIFTSSNGGKFLRLHQPSTLKDELLVRQWFHANQFTDQKSKKSIVILQLRGNPNDQSVEFDLPFATIDQYYPDPHVLAKPASSQANIVLTLFDVETLN